MIADSDLLKSFNRSSPPSELAYALPSNWQLPIGNLESNDRVRPTFNVQRVNKSDVPRLGCHHYRVSSFPCSKKSHALEQSAVSHACGREYYFFAGRQVIGVVNFIRIFDSH